MPENHIDLTPIVSAVAVVLTEPFNRLLDRLLVDGRVTEQELDQLRAEVLERGERMPDLIAAELAKQG